jgi:hypothetical protein
MRISLTFVILTKFLASDNSFNKEQPMLNKKKIFMKIAQPYAAITLAVKTCTALC